MNRMSRMIRKGIAGMAFAGILLTPGCGLRYDVQKPPSMEKKVVSLRSLRTFRNWKPKPSDLPLPKALQKKNPEDSFITLKRE